MRFVDHYIPEPLKESGPAGVMRQDPLVNHVRITDHHVTVLAHRLARITGRIAIVGEHPHAQVCCRIKLHQFGNLVLTERLGRKQIKGLSLRTPYRIDNRQVVAERFPRCGRRHNY